MVQIANNYYAKLMQEKDTSSQMIVPAVPPIGDIPGNPLDGRRERRLRCGGELGTPSKWQQ